MLPRLPSLLLAACLVVATTTVAATTQAAPAAPPPYVPLITTGFDDYGDQPDGADVEDGTVRLDPNLGRASVAADLDAWTSEPRVLVTVLGTRTDTGGCRPTLELVATNQSTDLVVRTPGETTTPAANRDPGGFDARVDGDPLLPGKVLQCARFRLLDAEGNVLDSARPSRFGSRRTDNARLYLSELGEPRQVPFNAWVRQRLRVVADPIGYDAQVTLQAPDGVELRNVSKRTFHGKSTLIVTFDVRATTRGLHALRLRATAGNAVPTAGVSYVWAPGGPHLPGTGSLAGRKVARFWKDCDRQGDNCRRQRKALWFLGNGLVYVGVPQHGAPRCTAAMIRPATDRGCQRYWWDKRRGLLQVGRWLGRVDEESISYRAQSYGDNFGLARRGTRYHVLLECDEWQCSDKFALTLRLTRTGRFVLRSRTFGSELTTTARGRYAIGAQGRLTLRFRSGRTEVRTLGIGRYPATGPLSPRHQGVLISLPGGRGPVWLTPPF